MGSKSWDDLEEEAEMLGLEDMVDATERIAGLPLVSKVKL